MGPTASGKTDLAIDIYKQLPCELISVDSALVYKGMDIGTAKPTPEILAEFPHHLIDIKDPAEPYSAADFRVDAAQLIADIIARKKIPLLVGGTMLYFKALKDGLAEMPAADDVIRQQISAEASQHGWAYIHAQLASVDPESAQRIHPNDPQRLQRALEVYRSSGKTMTQFRREQQFQRQSFPYHVISLAVAPKERKVLHQRIEKRFLQMIDQGFLTEVTALRQRADLNCNLPSIRSVGYRQAWEYLAGELSYEEMIEKGIVATRQLAKRQFTWLRSWPKLHWFDSLDQDLPAQTLKFVEQALI
ncbi:tRNA (adenosine(37)-N6)-dimethylallyltransferase MiaA [Endozoicomonas sp. SM1973]|uniref:tRNA dimethylallyltransferase n=1 Tax=Spartinivicinus marinus TaxID=2994442 RepID=A0A853IA16_9GAMM|nr:tRNA (adenosine(37)-N6)-dimethylallyltransferase MiaA [Spartinivicinus marinus]MCX4027601.1 tRNA (adenosine(37)-N6)-dimethylallyltransferase MiaA [Spartinivicinus marinus]NYZ66701.1 tRNA (adenosine(37)-N6)-dimethylallyltransferase MiaA [Spartinivicinus marinus]